MSHLKVADIIFWKIGQDPMRAVKAKILDRVDVFFDLGEQRVPFDLQSRGAGD